MKRDWLNDMNWSNTGDEMYALIEDLFPICRSITGNGVRQTLQIISEIIPLDLHEVPSGEKVFDWTIPKEWNINDAYIKNKKGERIVDFKKSNLHVLNYSAPIDKEVTLNDLKPHLFTLPEQPDWIPYRTSYHNENWGFCLSHHQLEKMKDERYDVKIDASLENGSLSYGEFFVKGETDDEVLMTCHVCHPSLCNDNLSGIAVATFLAKTIMMSKPKYSYRFLFIPVTIGSIAWLSLNQKNIHNIKHGLVLSLLGDASSFHYKKTKAGNAEIDRTVLRVLKKKGLNYQLLNFQPYGYDERQFNSPGINLPVGRLSRKPNGEFPEYHTSADNLDFMNTKSLAESLELVSGIVQELDNAEKYINLSPKCEPQLGKRGLYKKIGGDAGSVDLQMAILWTLNLSDGDHSLQDVVEMSGVEPEMIRTAVNLLMEKALIKRL